MELLADIIYLEILYSSSKHCQLEKLYLEWMNIENLQYGYAQIRGVVNFLVMGSIPASSDTVESEGRQMKQCWIKYIKQF